LDVKQNGVLLYLSLKKNGAYTESFGFKLTRGSHLK